MKIIHVYYPTTLEKISDYTNDNIDVIVELEDGNRYVLVVTTPLNILSLMSKNFLSYVPASPPCVIVKELTHQNILSALETYCEGDAYWLKLYHTAGDIEISHMEYVIKKLIDE